ncbi:MAG: hypothetical protein IT445_15610 [Phycisphaeraceae bacterium]|nr:hypothetical protein [Phycisphaeraceae bacterium]
MYPTVLDQRNQQERIDLQVRNLIVAGGHKTNSLALEMRAVLIQLAIFIVWLSMWVAGDYPYIQSGMQHWPTYIPSMNALILSIPVAAALLHLSVMRRQSMGIRITLALSFAFLQMIALFIVGGSLHVALGGHL